MQLRKTAPEPQVPALRAAPASDAPASNKPARSRRWTLWGGAGLLAVLLAAVAYSQLWMARPLPVGVETAAFAPVTRVLAVNGRIAAVRSVEVRSMVPGRLGALPASEGDEVEAGEVLARIDAEAQAAVVRQAMAGLDAALVAQDQARETHDRSLALGSNVPRSQLEDEARAVQSAAQEVARLTAVLEQAQVVLRDHTILAPIGGTVVEVNTEVGQTVDSSARLLILADMSDLVVEADVDEAYATQISLNQPAVLQLAGETGTRDGHVSFVSTVVDASTGGLAVRIAFDAPIVAPIGLTVATNIIVDRRDAALTVPRAALQTVAEETGVYLVSDGTARFQPVTVVDWPAARLVVTSGLAEGDVVISDAEGVVDGLSVAADQP